MRVIAIQKFGGPEELGAMDIPRPRPGKGEVLIRVVAAGVNPIDCKIRRGEFAEHLPHAFPLIPGWDVAGVVEEFGEGAARFRRGDRVWACARKTQAQWGCYAEYVSIPSGGIAPMPSKLLFEEAAAMPLAGLAAYQALFGKPGLDSDSTVLIHAGSGGVGHLAIQLAKNAGATVFATAGSDNQQFILGLGAKTGIDYTDEDFAEAVRRRRPDGIDLVVDTVGGDTTGRSLSVLRSGGRLVSLVQSPDPDEARRCEVQAYLLTVQPDAEQLGLMARMVDRGQLRPEVQKIYGLKEAAEAHQALEEGHVRGKLVLNL